jgi:hypothetical protein
MRSPGQVVRLIGSLCGAGALAGCVQSASTLPACAAPKPVEGGGLAMSAEVPGTDAAARKKALAEALVEGLGPVLGVGVRSKLAFTDVASTKNGVTNESSTTSQDVEVSFGAAKVKDYSVSYCASASGGTHAEVRLTGRELGRLKRIARNATLLVVGCSSEAAGACTADLRDRGKALAQGAGLEVGEAVLVQGEPQIEDLRTRAFTAGTTKVLVVRLDAPTVFEEEPYRVCRAQVAATLFDMEEGKVLEVAKPAGYGSDGAYKGVAYADKGQPKDACAKAFREGLGALEPMTTGWAAAR